MSYKALMLMAKGHPSSVFSTLDDISHSIPYNESECSGPSSAAKSVNANS